MANWHDFEKDAAVYFERLHHVFAKLDLQTVEKQNEWLSSIAIKYSSELKFAYGRVRVSVRYRPAVCIDSVCLHTAGRMHRISLRMHTAGRMHSIGHQDMLFDYKVDMTEIDMDD